MNQELQSENNRHLTPLSRISLYLGITTMTLSLLSSIFLYINWDVLPIEAKGPHPLIGLIGYILLNCMLLAFIPILFICLIFVTLSIYKKPFKRNVVTGLAGLFLAFISWPLCTQTLERVRSAPIGFYTSNLRQLSYSIKKYTIDNNGNLPLFSNWSESLIKNQSFSEMYFRKNPSQNYGLSEYAFNKNLSGLKSAEIGKDTVLIFETKLAKNPAGGAELIKDDNHLIKGCFIVFCDLHAKFVRAEDFNNLRWKP